MKKIISAQNQELAYWVEGKGQPVMLVHGFAEDHEVWKHQVSALSNRVKLILPDLPGSGESGLLAETSMVTMAESLKAIADAEGIGMQPGTQLLLVGHSMGGYITLAFAERWPELLAGFGLFHSTAFPDSDEKKANRRKGIAFIQSHGSHEFIRQSTPNLFTEDYRNKNSGVLSEMIMRYRSFDPSALTAYYEAMIKRPDRIAVLRSFNKPILFIAGKADKTIPIEDSLKQCHLPEIASIHIFQDSAHMGMWEEPEKSAKTLLSFVDEATVNRMN